MNEKLNKIKFISHASILIEINDNESMICDPWFEGRIFNTIYVDMAQNVRIHSIFLNKRL